MNRYAFFAGVFVAAFIGPLLWDLWQADALRMPRRKKPTVKKPSAPQPLRHSTIQGATMPMQGTKETVTMQHTEIVYRNAGGTEVRRERMCDDSAYSIDSELWDGQDD